MEIDRVLSFRVSKYRIRKRKNLEKKKRSIYSELILSRYCAKCTLS